MPKISVIVPVYNSEKVVNRCIDSILKQTYSDFELILINDGSKDKSIDILKDYEKKDLRIRVIDNENNGVSETRNIGINEAKGDYIQFVDSDDYIDEDMLKESLEQLEKNSVDIVMSGIYLDIEKNGVANSSTQTYEYKFANNNTEIVENVLTRLGGTYINSPINKLYKRSIIKENNIYMNKEIDLGEDLLFNLEYLKHCNSIIFGDKCYYHYCMRAEENLTAKYRDNKLDLMKILYDKCMEFLNKYEASGEKIRELNSIYIKWMYSAFIDLHNKSCPYKYKDKIKFIKKYTDEDKEIVLNSTSNGLVFNILRWSLRYPKIVFIISKTMYVIKNNFRQIMYK